MNAPQGWQQSLKRLGATRKEGPDRVLDAERCDLCSAEIPARHQHLIEPGSRQLMCACPPCALLFDTDGRTQYRRIPRDPRLIPDLRLSEESWARLLVPVSLAFFYPLSEPKRILACYPSPAGVTESLVEPEAWAPIVQANPSLGALRDDIEALLVNRMDGRRECFIAPIDQCFELVGLVRRHWRGFSGGDLVWERVAELLSRIRESARP